MTLERKRCERDSPGGDADTCSTRESATRILHELGLRLRRFGEETSARRSGGFCRPHLSGSSAARCASGQKDPPIRSRGFLLRAVPAASQISGRRRRRPESLLSWRCYMGSFWVSDRADLTPVYEMIFRRLKDDLLDWRYRFPAPHLIEFPTDRPDRRRSYELEKLRAELEQA